MPYRPEASRHISESSIRKLRTWRQSASFSAHLSHGTKTVTLQPVCTRKGNGMTTLPSHDDPGDREFEQRILAVVPRVVRVAFEAGERDIVTRLDRVEQQLRRTGMTVVVLGQFSSGKSSLLNALLEDPEG